MWSKTRDLRRLRIDGSTISESHLRIRWSLKSPQTFIKCLPETQVFGIIADVSQLKGRPQQENFGGESGGRDLGRECWTEGAEVGGVGRGEGTTQSSLAWIGLECLLGVTAQKTGEDDVWGMAWCLFLQRMNPDTQQS